MPPFASSVAATAPVGHASASAGAPRLPSGGASVTSRPPSAPPPLPSLRAIWRDALGGQATPALRYEPKSREDVLAVVGDAARRGVAIRAVGAGQSSSGVARPEGEFLDLRAMRKALPVNGLRPGVLPSSFVRAEAGMTLEDLAKLLHVKRVGVAGLDASSKRSLAGAIATGAHDASPTSGALADAVASVDLVVLAADRGRLSPRLVRLEPTAGISDPRWFVSASGSGGGGSGPVSCELVQDDDLFYGAVVGLGATGVAVAYTLAVGPRAHDDDGAGVEEMTFEMPWEDVAPQLIDLAQANDFVEITLYPHPTGARASGATRDACIVCTLTTRRYTGGGAQVSSVELTGTRGARAHASYRSRSGSMGRPSATELCVPLEDAARAVAAILDETEALRRDGAPHSGPLTLRFSGASRHALAPNRGRPTCSIDAALPAGARRSPADADAERDPEGGVSVVRRLFDVVDAACRTGRARPGWGRLFELTGAELGARYEDAALWRKACHAFDPRGSFLNATTRALLWNGR